MTHNEQTAASLQAEIDAKRAEKNTVWWEWFNARNRNDTAVAIAADCKVADLEQEIGVLSARRRAALTRGERCGHELAIAQ